ncbi:hypothetical protein ASPZODRAFT_72043 [Penicilliopsis zonata CBS 506.65]|uniref:Zn(2)-C6 fungal-type domain-containing protein n=1 Tax=Penicilliopsis zonata CBS 506.65 TaxID=1073090 RepID=A0A1L9SAW3_9EURO|nr:hypothetical protein ASPZODRAFT_72043 [Penicilliopsis zonata CBS 506.65]OJJ44257.1 hypothetical protein ASPZODRAFT_72043 [Penicilliopsis zonata CBS 506.65]
MVYRGKPSTGCQTCRTRRIKCDETRPSCKACARVGRPCPGYRHPFDVILRDQTASVQNKNSSSRGTAAEGEAVSRVSSSMVKPSRDASSAGGSEALLNVLHLLSSRQSLSVALQPAIEDTVLSCFFNSYLYIPRDPEITDGVLELIPTLYPRARSGSHLQLATLAVAFFSVFAWTGHRPFAPQAVRYYMNALTALRAALQGNLDGEHDDILTSILLLYTFEAKSSRCLLGPVISSPRSWFVSSNHIRPDIMTSSELASLSCELGELRTLWQKIRSQTCERGEILKVLSMAVENDNKLAVWKSALPLHWAGKTASWIPQSVRNAGIFRNQCDCYPDIFVASIWNSYRDSRILVQTIMIECLGRLPPEESRDGICAASETINTLATDICATVPFFLGDQTTPMAFNGGRVEYPDSMEMRITDSHRQMAPLFGGWFVYSFLENLCSPEIGLSDEYVVFVQQQMQRLRCIFFHAAAAAPSPTPSTQEQAAPAPGPASTISTPQASSRIPNSFKLLLGGVSFFYLSLLITRRALAKRRLAALPPFYTGSIYHKPEGNGAVDALEALSIATVGVASAGMAGTGATLCYFNINSMADLRREVRTGMGFDVDANGNGGSDELGEAEIEEWLANVLGRTAYKEKKKEIEERRALEKENVAD